MSSEQTEYDEVMNEMLNKQHDLTRDAFDAIADRDAELSNVIDGILMSDETLTGEVLNNWISRFPQFESEITDFAVREAVAEFTPLEPTTEAEDAARLERNRAIVADVISKSKAQKAEAQKAKDALESPGANIEPDVLPDDQHRVVLEIAATLRKRFPNKEKRSKVWEKVWAAAVEMTTATATMTESETTFDDVIDEMWLERETAKNWDVQRLKFWVSRFPQFAGEIAEFWVNEVISELTMQNEVLIEFKTGGRLTLSQSKASDVIKSGSNQSAKDAAFDVKNIDTSKPQKKDETCEMPNFLTFYADVVLTFVPESDETSAMGTGFFLFKNSADLNGSKLILMERAAIKEAIYKLHAQFESESVNQAKAANEIESPTTPKTAKRFEELKDLYE